MRKKDIESQDTERKEEKKKRYNWIVNTILIIVIILVLLLMFRSCRAKDTHVDDRFEVGVDGDTSDISDGRTQDEIIADLNNKVKESEINITMNSNPVFKDGKSAGNLLIKNNEINNYPQMVEIYLKDSNKLVYKSGLIPVGKAIDSAKLTEDLDAGTYEAVACFFNIVTEKDENTGKELASKSGEARAEILITVQN